MDVVNELEMETHEHMPGWLPLIASPQFEFCEADHTALFEPLELCKFARASAQYDNTLTFRYSGSINEALETRFEDM